MPREQINYPVTERLMSASSDGEAEEYDHTDPTLHISWITGLDTVQLMMEITPKMLQQLTRFSELEPSSPNPNTWIHSPILDRGEINKMIRTLRRARDAAYGKDE